MKDFSDVELFLNALSKYNATKYNYNINRYDKMIKRITLISLNRLILSLKSWL